jgi:hypothetical protein
MSVSKNDKVRIFDKSGEWTVIEVRQDQMLCSKTLRSPRYFVECQGWYPIASIVTLTKAGA